MSWKVKPLNKRILLEKVQLDTSMTKVGGFDFVLPTQHNAQIFEFFKVLDIAEDCDKMAWKLEKGDLVVSENVLPVGKFGTKELFLSSETAITALLKEDV